MWVTRIDYRGPLEQELKPLNIADCRGDGYEESQRLTCVHMWRLVRREGTRIKLLAGGFASTVDKAPLDALGELLDADGVMYYVEGPGWEWL